MRILLNSNIANYFIYTSFIYLSLFVYSDFRYEQLKESLGIVVYSLRIDLCVFSLVAVLVLVFFEVVRKLSQFKLEYVRKLFIEVIFYFFISYTLYSYFASNMYLLMTLEIIVILVSFYFFRITNKLNLVRQIQLLINCEEDYVYKRLICPLLIFETIFLAQYFSTMRSNGLVVFYSSSYVFYYLVSVLIILLINILIKRFSNIEKSARFIKVLIDVSLCVFSNLVILSFFDNSIGVVVYLILSVVNIYYLGNIVEDVVGNQKVLIREV